MGQIDMHRRERVVLGVEGEVASGCQGQGRFQIGSIFSTSAFDVRYLEFLNIACFFMHKTSKQSM
jgi:hypothetical protein